MYYSFQYYRLPPRWHPTAFPLRPQNLFTSRISPARQLSYWWRPHTSKTRHPIVFLHGIGIGLYPYLEFLSRINNPAEASLSKHEKNNYQDDGQIGVLMIEILPISFRMTAPALRKEEFLKELTIILSHHKIDHFTLVAHSYGTMLTTQLMHSKLAPRISNIILIDPVCLLLHLPDTAYNFTRRQPREANEWQLWYFACTDPDIAHMLARRSFWHENIMWREDIEKFTDKGIKVSIFLGGRDCIVNAAAIWTYLTNRSRKVLGKGKNWADGAAPLSTESDTLPTIPLETLQQARVLEKPLSTSSSSSGLMINGRVVTPETSPSSSAPSLLKSDIGEELHAFQDEDGTHEHEFVSANGNMRVVWGDELDHAVLFHSLQRMPRLVREVREFATL
jgi:pimeloyl-ACP methyl ester carboxylesterase